MSITPQLFALGIAMLCLAQVGPLAAIGATAVMLLIFLLT